MIDFKDKILTLLTVTLIIVMVSNLLSQKHDYVWCMGYESTSDTLNGWGGQNIDFNSGNPKVSYVNRAMDFLASSTSICDRQGRLLFYSNGCKIFNADHVLMEGGDSLTRMDNSWTQDFFCPYGFNATQGMLILPDPYDTLVYYLFHQDIKEDAEFYPYTDELFVTTVSFKDNAKGAVIKKRDLLINERLDFGGMTATKKANGKDWWIVFNSNINKFYVAELNQDGYKLNNVQNIGLHLNSLGQARSAKFSQDGKIYSRFHIGHGLDIFDFDRKTGEFSNARYTPFWRVRTPFELGNGLEYSPDSKLLYITYGKDLVQFDLTANDIFGSMMLIDTFVPIPEEDIFQSRFYQMQMGPNNKIYMAHLNSTQTMHVIHNPNGRGADCNFRMRDLKLRTWNGYTMPYFPNFRLGPDTTVTTIDIRYSSLSIFPNPASTHITLSLDLSTEYSYTITNTSGQTIQSGQVPYDKTIDISDCVGGLYIIKATDRLGKVAVGKFIVVN